VPDTTIISFEIVPGEEKIIKLTAVSDEFGFGIGTSFNVMDAELH